MAPRLGDPTLEEIKRQLVALDAALQRFLWDHGASHKAPVHPPCVICEAAAQLMVYHSAFLKSL